MLNEEERKFLLELARKTIETFVKTGQNVSEDESKLTPNLKERRAVFVSIYNGEELKGCIGTLVARQELYRDVIENSIKATQDPRFLPIREKELNDLKIEISVLSVPEKLSYKDPEDLLSKIVPGKHGLIIKKGFHTATFLPQVWEKLPNKEEFLGQLCLKAGLSHDEWRHGIEIQTYEVELI